MDQTVSLDQLPRTAEQLLKRAWEKGESVVLERDGEPVAAVVPMDKYRRLQHESPQRETAEMHKSPLAYELPPDLMADYDRLLNKKFDDGLTPEEEAEFGHLAESLSDADMATPLGNEIIRHAQAKHERWMDTLNEVVAKLRELRETL